eukprot:CAMPEP_0201136978 /NCGR_PEP_ID=MMETSP0850-20130426/55165_1 /ASSEMBLY_ACC=CAM_ASM_000622 /TAXON_ID=183588 /ORGANISM="Pseudo-nitzschia fraudulenta, Strain WWA7" /LENGTH=524 /DNA_ID=CAMNT_0047408309 /DNA_START=756 /DNA_END=2330 /DNA_ORIENTATION=+
MLSFRLALIPFLLSASTVQATTPDNVSSRLMIHIPHKLFKEEGYDHREALFGIPPYGGKIAQNVYYADDELCDPNVDTTKGYPRREKDKNGKMTEWVTPYILMVDRGGCTFVKKVRNAQRSGASGVVIADNTCLCSDVDCINASENPTCETSEPIMADDGSGSDISIPSFLMFKHDADRVKDQLTEDQPVQLEMSWSLPNPDGRVEYDLWSTPSDQVSKQFLYNFKTVSKALGDRAYFTPHQYIYDGIKTHCQGDDGENFCYNLCTNKGRYCATDPDNDLDQGISGADVVKESLRRLCIWKHYGEQDGVGQVWWDYITQFMDRCNTPDYFMNEACVKDCYKHAKVDGDSISQCMDDSGGLKDDGKNSLLELELDAQSERGVVVLPTAFVNTAAMRGQLSAKTVFSAICAGFSEGTLPTICEQCSGCEDTVQCIANKGKCTSGVHGASTSGQVSTHTFGYTIFFMAIAFAGVGYWHYNKTRDDMREQVRGILAEYMPLEDQDGNAGGNPMEFAMSARDGSTPLFS